MTTGAQLYGVTVLGDNTEFIESSTSFCFRLSVSHGWSPHTLFRVINSCRRNTERLAVNWAFDSFDGRAMNTYGKFQRVITASLVRFTSVEDLSKTTLAHIGPSFANNAMGAVKNLRHWCRMCFSNARRMEVDAYDMLIWQMADLTICPLHSCPLESKCSKCNSHQLFFPRTRALDLCGKCGSWLGMDSQAGASPVIADISYQRWLSKAYSELILARNEIHPRLTGHECSVFIKSMGAFRQMTTVELSDYSGIPLDSLYRWAEGRMRPKLVSWARLCANLNVGLAATLLDPAESARQLSMPFELPKIYFATREKPRAKHSKKDIQLTLNEQLSMKRPSIQSIPQLALQLNIPISMLYFHAPTEVKALSAKLKNLKKQKRKIKRMSLLKSLQRAAERLKSKDLPITRETLIEEAATRQKNSQHSVKKYFSDAIKKINPDQEGE